MLEAQKFVSLHFETFCHQLCNASFCDEGYRRCSGSAPNPTGPTATPLGPSEEGKRARIKSTPWTAASSRTSSSPAARRGQDKHLFNGSGINCHNFAVNSYMHVALIWPKINYDNKMLFGGIFTGRIKRGCSQKPDLRIGGKTGLRTMYR